MNQLSAVKENQVVGIARSEMEAKENFHPIALDLADSGLLISKLDRIFSQGEYENVFLINNAGWIGEIAPLGSLDPAGIEQIHNLNIIAPALLMNEFIKRYKEQKGKKIVINISSGAARKAIDGWSGYCSSKAALNQLSLVAEEESNLKRLGIKYYALSPGIIDTTMQENIRSSSREDFSQVDDFKSYKTDNQLSSPEETASKVIYLMNNSEDFPEVLQDVREF